VPVAQPGDLLPRYRRPLTFGAILDETFRIFRRAWRPLMLALAAGAVPYGVVSALGSGWITRSTFSLVDATSGAAAADELGPLMGAFGGLYGGALGIALLGALFLIPAYGAVVALTDGELRGRRLPVRDALRRGLRATPRMLLFFLLSFLLGLALLLAAVPLFALGLFGILGGLVALIGILVWWGNPRARRPWLCWLIILATPFGLPLYYGYRWVSAVPAIVLEGAGPREALGRSSALTRGHWFRIFGSLTVLGIISTVLQSIPSMIIGIAGAAAGFAVAAARGGEGDPQSAQLMLTLLNVFSAAARSLAMIAFGALPFIALTLLFQDLRNRHEGADLAERLAAVEAAGGGVGRGVGRGVGAAAGTVVP
jgi:hypothetical protein